MPSADRRREKKKKKKKRVKGQKVMEPPSSCLSSPSNLDGLRGTLYATFMHVSIQISFATNVNFSRECPVSSHIRPAYPSKRKSTSLALPIQFGTASPAQLGHVSNLGIYPHSALTQLPLVLSSYVQGPPPHGAAGIASHAHPSSLRLPLPCKLSQ